MMKEEMKLSNKKNKDRVIRVNKLIVHADDVVIIPRRRPHDPWLFRRPSQADLEAVEHVREETTTDETDHHEDDKGRNSFSWI
jgi:hypothetical protein